MKTEASSRDAYRDQLSRCAQALAVGAAESVRSDLARGMTPDHVRLFTDGNLDKRFEKLQSQSELLHDDFDGFDSLLHEYIHSVPSGAYDSGTSDCARLIEWLSAHFEISPEQRDLIACLQCRHAVEMLAGQNRVAYLHFHDLRSLSERHDADGGYVGEPMLLLNPIRTWGVFQTGRLLDEDAVPPADVLFYALDGDVRTAVLEDPGKSLVRLLEQIGPCTLESWAVAAQTEREDVAEFASELMEMGLLVAG